MRKTCLDQVYLLAQKDPRVIFIGSDIGAGTLDAFKREMPDRFYMEGVSEAHLISMMAGLAMSGKIPYLNTIATFISRRPFEHVLLDGGLHHTKIRLIGSGGGVVYGPLGPTHLALEDMAILRTIPGMAVVAPCDAEEMKRLMPQTLEWDGPMYIRLGKGGDPVVSRAELGFQIGKAILLQEGRDVLLVSTGITAQTALEAAGLMAAEGLQAAVQHMHTVKPFDRNAFLEQASRASAVISLEEHTVIGGLGSACAEALAEAGFDRPKRFARLGFPDVFPHSYGSQAELMEKYGITASDALKTAQKLLESKSRQL
ncbi:MAG: transketolase [Omnitrophica bacterium GWA2_52_8]|nr:MAG: transketolase [Omnitrophica bacterium GWA2_52_8]